MEIPYIGHDFIFLLVSGLTSSFHQETKLDEIDDDIQKEKMSHDITWSMKMLLRNMTTKCRIELPDLPDIANELDRNFKKVREMKLVRKQLVSRS